MSIVIFEKFYTVHEKQPKIVPEHESTALSIVQCGTSSAYPGMQLDRFSTYGKSDQAQYCELLPNRNVKITKISKDTTKEWHKHVWIVASNNVAGYQELPSQHRKKWNGIGEYIE
jgi:hypothetical protein